MDLGLVEKVRK